MSAQLPLRQQEVRRGDVVVFILVERAARKESKGRIKNPANADTNYINAANNDANETKSDDSLPNVYSLQDLLLGGDFTFHHFGNYMIMMVIGDLLA